MAAVGGGGCRGDLQALKTSLMPWCCSEQARKQVDSLTQLSTLALANAKNAVKRLDFRGGVIQVHHPFLILQRGKKTANMD